MRDPLQSHHAHQLIAQHRNRKAKHTECNAKQPKDTSLNARTKPAQQAIGQSGLVRDIPE